MNYTVIEHLVISIAKNNRMISFLCTVCQVKFTSTYNNNKVTGIVGSSVNFTWTFSGDVKVAQMEINSNVLVSKDKTLQVTTITNSPYSGRVSVVWNGRSPGQVTFTLNLIRMTDEGSYICRLTPVTLGDISRTDTVQLIVSGKYKLYNVLGYGELRDSSWNQIDFQLIIHM